MKKADIRQFIIDHTTDCDISYRGGTLKVDVSELFPNVDEPIMGAYQNYLGGGIAGCIIGASKFDPEELSKKDQKLFYTLKEELKKYFFELNHGGGDEYMVEEVNSYEQNQKLPASGY
jgi:hypothetical protein